MSETRRRLEVILRLGLLLLLIGLLLMPHDQAGPTPVYPTLNLVTNTPAATPVPPPTVTTYQEVIIRQGPGDSYSEAGRLNPGVPAQVMERTRLGTWVRLRRLDGDKVVLDGWTLTGYLNPDPDLRFSKVPVNTMMADGNPANVDSETLKKLYTVPVIPIVDNSIGNVYQLGQQLGRNKHAVTKIGDSLVANPMYLAPMSNPQVDLGPYDYLADTIKYFSASTATPSLAARIGLNTLVVFDPMWADKSRCQPNEAPLDCEIRVKQPSIALVMFGPNDVKGLDTDKFHGQMEKLVQDLLKNGVIPVLFTFSYDPENELWWQAMDFNLTLVDLANTYKIPLVNLWLAARVLPEYGLERDHIHLKNSGFVYLKFSNGNEAQYGVTLQNLLALRTLDEIRRTVGMN
jgi:hypothetical protein